jgi:FkbM family methyltransferase
MNKLSNYSQLEQDINVLEFYNYKKGGYFIEIGASDGINLSNTYLLEKDYEWKGICIEPIPEKYNELLKNRKCICENEPIYSSSDIEIEFAICGKYDMYSGIYNHIVHHKKTVDSEKKIIKLKTKTLTDILDKNNAPGFIDYLSIDTEGSELEILRGINFNKYQFGTIDIEHNYVEPIRTSIKDFLIENDYIYLKENRWDDTYIHKSLEK